MHVGDLIECHKGQRGLIVARENVYPGNPYSPPYSVLIRWMGEAPTWHVKGRYTHISAIKKVISRANR